MTRDKQANTNSEREDRLDKLKYLIDKDINPFPSKTERSHSIAKLIENFAEFEKEAKNIVIAGRLMSKRGHGNLTFCHIFDGTAKIQVAVSKKDLGASAYKEFTKLIDVGDFVEFSGTCFVTHKGEKSLMVAKWKILTKALRPLPDKWHGLKDEEDILRKRYLDLLLNEKSRELFIKKSKFWEVIRDFMKQNGFFEVETPVLETTTGGAEANPFKTKHKDFGIDVYLRISVGELWQKRLMAAGFERTFEIGKVFRNEGSSPDHIQEFTNIEFYFAYANYRDGMELTKKLYQKIAQDVFGTYKFRSKNMDIDFSGDWPEIDYRDEILRQTKLDIDTATAQEMEKKLKELGVKYDGDNKERLMDSLWKYCRKSIAGPAFLLHHPKLVSPLAKSRPENKNHTERFQIIIAGTEIGNGYSELNNPLEQKKRFDIQQKLIDSGDSEAMMPDDEFVEMLEYGMPPTCGVGTGERLFSVLADMPIKEIALFPLLKPKQINAKKADNTAETTPELGINYAQAKKLVDKYIKDDISKLHLIESEAIMRSLAKHFGQDEEKWGIIGLLHDIDWDLTKDDIKNHTITAVDILKEAGANDFLIDTIESHCYGNKQCGRNPGKERTTLIEFSLVAAETITGLIVASALMQPDKKLSSVKLSSLKKKFKQKSFAAKCDRNLIREIKNTGLDLSKFFEISLAALQDIAPKLGL